ncbi:MAG: N-acetyltransferase [Flavobacterium sp.]|nr:MAG: N-acetyltransferase [Flavobacterium sp.]
MIEIKEMQPNEINIVQDIAHKTWPVTYAEILTNEQLAYMLASFYSTEALNGNIENGHHFLLAKENDETLGFASYVHNHPENFTTKIPKIYVLPEIQGKGIGKLLIEAIEAEANKNHSVKLTLNVNRNNNARNFYEKLGFAIAKEEDVPIGNGIFQEDFVMEKRLR